MADIRYVIGIDISTQAISAMLIGVEEIDCSPRELILSGAWMASRPCKEEADRKSPATWVRLVQECIADLKKLTRETDHTVSIGVSTAFSGAFPVFRDGSIDPWRVSLYDNTDDAGICEGRYEEALAKAEADTLNRMAPGNMAIGLLNLIKNRGLRLDEVAAVLPPNSAFAYALLQAAQKSVYPASIYADYTQTLIGGLYDIRTGQPIPSGVESLLHEVLPDIDLRHLKALLPVPQPAWRNLLDAESVDAARDLFQLPNLTAISIGAGDSPLGALALLPGADTVMNVRGSTDSPLMMIDHPVHRNTPREVVFHYPLPTAKSVSDSPWTVVAPTLRSGKLWDWVRHLRFSSNDPNADIQLEAMAIDSLKRRLRAPEGSAARMPLIFDTALGGERAPEWDAHATGSILGLLETHDLGDIALAGMEGVSRRLAKCIELMEQRYDRHPTRLVMVGGPAHNALWNWITQIFTGKVTFATTFSDASILGAAMIGYGSFYDKNESDDAISQRLFDLARLSSTHPLTAPVPVEPPDKELAKLETEYLRQVEET